jgi:hypothetical protein
MFTGKRQLRPSWCLYFWNDRDARTLSALIAIGAAMSALFLGERVGGPLVRAILGPPSGFHEDFTSRAAYEQALLVQGVFIGPRILLGGGSCRVAVQESQLQRCRVGGESDHSWRELHRIQMGLSFPASARLSRGVRQSTNLGTVVHCVSACFRPLPLCRGPCATPAPHGFATEDSRLLKSALAPSEIFGPVVSAIANTGPSMRIATAAKNATIMLAALTYCMRAASDADTNP